MLTVLGLSGFDHIASLILRQSTDLDGKLVELTVDLGLKAGWAIILPDSIRSLKIRKTTNDGPRDSKRVVDLRGGRGVAHFIFLRGSTASVVRQVATSNNQSILITKCRNPLLVDNTGFEIFSLVAS